jgi:lysozyme
MTHDTLIDQLIRHEGERFKPYRCTAGKLTIGVGRNLGDKGITQEESRYLLGNDIRECETDLQRIFPGFLGFSQGRQWALTDLRFNLGPTRFRTFRNMIAAVNRGDWRTAGNEALDSRWAIQVQNDRVDCIVRQLKEGI